jgi:hypothetical protein
MTNLAGVKDCDIIIQEELFIASIPSYKVDRNNGEVQYSYIGRLNNWVFKRAWHYWVASVGYKKDGLLLEKALNLHYSKYPIEDKNITILGKVIRSGGHCGCPSPGEYGAQPIYDENFINECISLNLDAKTITVGKISELCNSGLLKANRYVTMYHIDSQIGLNEFARFIKSL